MDPDIAAERQALTASAITDRRDRRLKVFLPSAMTAGAAELRVHVLNVSPGGAHLFCATAPRVRDIVALWLGGASHRALVRWVHPAGNGAHFGVAFAIPLDQAVLEGVLAR